MWMLVFLFLLVLIVLLAMKIKNNLNDKCKWVRVMSFGVRVSSGWSGSRSHGTVSWRTQHASAHALIAQDSHTIFYIFLTIIADREKQNSSRSNRGQHPPFTRYDVLFLIHLLRSTRYSLLKTLFMSTAIQWITFINRIILIYLINI